MHLRNRLSVKKIAKLSAANVYADGGGLYLRIRDSGSKSWLFIYMIDGQRREIGLGSAIDISLSKARELAAELREVRALGRDPRHFRQEQVTKSKSIPTFAEMASDFITSIEGGFRNAKHRQQWWSTIATYAAPISDNAVDPIDVSDIQSMLAPIWLSKAETASRVRQRVERILDAATVKGFRAGDNPARWRGNLEHLLPSQSKVAIKHHKALPVADLPGFMVKLRKRRGVAARALEFLILTAARTSEIIGARWSEIDFANGLWTVPASRMKAGKEHIVPLPQAALNLLDGIKATGDHNGGTIFRGPGGSGLSNMAMATLMRRMGVDVTVHGFRSTFREWAGEKTNHSRETVEMALAHVVASNTERAYRRGNALEKRRLLMLDWMQFAFSLCKT